MPVYRAIMCGPVSEQVHYIIEAIKYRGNQVDPALSAASLVDHELVHLCYGFSEARPDPDGDTITASCATAP